MSPLVIGLFVLVVLTVTLVTGTPIAFALGMTAVLGLLVFEGVESLEFLPETLFSGLDDFTLVSIPMFILMGAAVASSRAGSDLYLALDRWLYRVPGGLVISNLGACALFAALTGSSPATCAAIGKMGIPEMRRRGYPDEIATGSIAAGGTLGILIPPSLTFILYGIATESSIGRLFLAGVVPGILLTGMFMAWTWFAVRRSGYQAYATDFRFTWREKFTTLPKVLPFLAIIVAVMWALYGGVATPSEAAGVGALFCVLLAIVIYRMWRASDWWAMLRDTTRESVMILLIIGTAILFGYMLTSLYLTQSLAEWIATLDVNRWVLMGAINVLLLVAGCFLPPAAIILMTAPILLPIITAAGFDPIWFGVILTINMEVGLITPPVGLNLYVINGIVPDVPLGKVLRGAIPYVLCMLLAIVIISVFPGLATGLPNYLMGPVQ
ncbi:MAG TPA: TRAP transporter large permease [Geminicoccaceae bacterium]|nr:TRAP transporter large permease [Geminicoccaceae bacterium]